MIAKDDPELLALLGRLLFEEDDEPRADRTVGLVLADWLEERGDSRAADVRTLAAIRLPEVRFPTEEEAQEAPPADEEGKEEDEEAEVRSPQPIWRWPPSDEPSPPWWDLLVELDNEGYAYVRWHADPYTEVGRRILMQTGGYVGSHHVPREEIGLALDRCLGELMVALLGWSVRDLERRQRKKG